VIDRLLTAALGQYLAGSPDPRGYRELCGDTGESVAEQELRHFLFSSLLKPMQMKVFHVDISPSGV